MTSRFLREARYQDLPQVSSLTGKAFWEDDLLGDRIHPYREKYPQDVDLYWLRRARVHYFDARWRFVVAVSRDTSEHDIILGCAQWSRIGKGGDKMEYSRLDPRRYVKGLMAIAMRAHALVWPNRAANPHDEDIIERTMPFVDEAWTGDRAECWYLEVLAVSPDFQSQGIGRLLVDWGLRRAREEGIHASVISARGKEPFYQKCGFHLEDGHVGSGVGNPLHDWEGGRMFWMVPEGQPT